MNLINIVVINMYSIALLLVMLVHTLKIYNKNSVKDKIFVTMMVCIILILIADILGRFDGNPETFYPILNRVGNFLLFLGFPIMPSLWVAYVYYQIRTDKASPKKILGIIYLVGIVNTALVIISQFTGWIYYIDEQNIYHRGFLIAVPILFAIVLIIVAAVITLSNRHKLEKKQFFSLLFFPVPAILFAALQIRFYGTPYALNGIVFSLLIVLLNIQNQYINTDYLTGINNRKKLDSYLREKISTCTVDSTFSAIIVDLDDFKAINDTFGHIAGDEALEITANLFKSCLRPRDFIARYGGDEFFIVLDISNKKALDIVINRINSSIKKYNESGTSQFKIAISMGYAVYDYHSHMSSEEFQKYVDYLMYKNKQVHKENRSAV